MKLETIQRKIIKQLPDAECKQDKLGDFYIRAEGENQMVKHMIPHNESDEGAWRGLFTCIRTQQNIRRGDPLKAIFYEDKEKRSLRISKRVKKNKVK